MRKLGFHTEGHQIATHTSSTRFPSELGIVPLKVLFDMSNNLPMEHNADSTFPAKNRSTWLLSDIITHVSLDSPPKLLGMLP